MARRDLVLRVLDRHGLGQGPGVTTCAVLRHLFASMRSAFEGMGATAEDLTVVAAALETGITAAPSLPSSDCRAAVRAVREAFGQVQLLHDAPTDGIVRFDFRSL